jgi:hypothetical protein
MKRFKPTALSAVLCLSFAHAVIISPRDTLLKRMPSIALRILIAQWR